MTPQSTVLSAALPLQSRTHRDYSSLFPQDCYLYRRIASAGALFTKLKPSVRKKIKQPPADLLTAALEYSGPRWVKSRGGCHGELIPDGAEVLLEPFGAVPPQVGEIAAYINHAGLEVIHRLCHFDAGGWWGNADTVLAVERTGALIGRVTARRYNGSTNSLRSLPGRARLAWVFHRLYHRSHGRWGNLGRWILRIVQRLKERLYPTK